jgi:hypothetical protein
MSGTCGTGIQNHAPISGQPMVKVLFAGGAVPLSIGLNSASPEDPERFSQRWQAILGGVQESLGGEDPRETGTSGELGTVTPPTNSGAIPENRLPGMKDREACVAGKFVLKASDASDLPDSVPRSSPHKLRDDYLPSGSTSNQQAEGISADNSDLHLQKFSSGSNKSAKLQTRTESNPSTSATNPELMLSIGVIPRLDSVPPSDNLSGPALSPRDVLIPIEKPTDNASRNTAAPKFNVLANRAAGGRPNVSAGSDLELERQTSPVASPNHRGPQPSSDEIGQEDQPVSIRSENAGAADLVPSMESQLPVHSSSNERSVSSTAMKNFSISSASADTASESRTRTAAPPARASNAESFQHDRVGIGDTPRPLSAKTNWGIPSTHLNNSASGTQTVGEFHAGQSASVPAVGTVSVPGSGSSASTQQHHASTRETFATIDAGTDDDTAKWVIGGEHRAEAGFQDPSLGWVSVRAQGGAGGIHAAVVPASDVAAQALGGHLAGLNAHLANQYEHLNPVTLSAPDTGWNRQNTGREMSQGDGAGTSHGGQQQMQEDRGPARIEPVAHFPGGFAEEPQSGVPMQTFAAGSNPIDGHVSFVV